MSPRCGPGVSPRCGGADQFRPQSVQGETFVELPCWHQLGADNWSPGWLAMDKVRTLKPDFLDAGGGALEDF